MISHTDIRTIHTYVATATFTIICITYICRLENDLKGKELELIKAQQQCKSLQSSIVQQNEELKNLHKRYVFTYVYAYVIVSLHVCTVSTVPLNYNFTFTRVSTRVTTRGSRGKCQKLPWKASFPRDGPWLFHMKTRGISRHVAFPRDETWHFHETSRGISTRPVTVESRVEFSRDQ